MLRERFHSRVVGYKYKAPLCVIEQEKITFRKLCTQLALRGCHCIFLSSEKKLVSLVTRASLLRFISGKFYRFLAIP